IPLAMESLLRKGQSQPGDTALLIAFGAGLSYAAQVVTLPRFAAPAAPIPAAADPVTADATV
ncbi:3-oxoacyl-[acyl-carrier-protein] synthase III C-terminal domain-containing protein, partial [Nocardia brasiliensis]